MSEKIPLIDYARQETVFSSTVDVVQLNLSALYERVRRLCAISMHDDYVGWMTYFELIIVQLRALCCERREKLRNYTIQGLLFRIGDSAAANAFERFLNETVIGELNGEKISIDDAIKKLADKFICHYDDCLGTPSQMVAVRNKLMRMLIDGDLLIGLITKIQDVVEESLAGAATTLKVKVIEHLFGSVDEYNRIKTTRVQMMA